MADETDEPIYELHVSNESDFDGDYRVDIRRDGTTVQTIFRRDRAAAIRDATRWVEHQREPKTGPEVIRL